MVPLAAPPKVLRESPEPLGPQATGIPISTPDIDSVAVDANAVVGTKAIKATPTAIASRCVRNLGMSASSDRYPQERGQYRGGFAQFDIWSDFVQGPPREIRTRQSHQSTGCRTDPSNVYHVTYLAYSG